MNLKKMVYDNKLILQINDDNVEDMIKYTKSIIKFCDKNGLTIELIYNGKKIDEKYLNKDISNKLRDIITIMHAVNIKNIEERYNYIYDTVCSYLDERIKTNYCEFKDNICVKYRKKGSNHENGCCECKGRGRCKYLIDGVCTMKTCIACKLFTCHTLKKMGITQNINDFALTKYFFTAKQKDILQFSYWTPKEIVMENLMKESKEKTTLQ